MRTQTFEGMQNDGATQKREILFGHGRLHALTLTTRRYQSPDSVGSGHKCRPTAFVWI
jgi:hypothetical protein